MIDHEQFPIVQTVEEEIVGNEIVLVPKVIYGIHVPLRKTLKLFLELPGLFNKLKENVKNLSRESNLLTNIMQGNLWLRKYAGQCTENIVGQCTQNIVLPLCVFFDELEVGKPSR